MAQLFDKDGNIVEALTPEEVEGKLNEIKEQTKEEVETEKQGEIDDLKIQLEEKEDILKAAQDDLEREMNKDKNLGGQRRVIEAKEKEIDGLKKGMDDLKKTMEGKLQEIESNQKEKMVDDMIDRLAMDDQELKDKIKFYYNNFKPIDEKGKKKEDIEKEIVTRIQNAHTLAGGTKPAMPLSSQIISSAGGAPTINPTGEKLDSDLQDLAHRMGIDDSELKKHKLV